MATGLPAAAARARRGKETRRGVSGVSYGRVRCRTGRNRLGPNRRDIFVNMKEWLDREIDIAAGQHDADSSTPNVVEINQRMLATAVTAIMVLDARLQALEIDLGKPIVDFVAEGKRVDVRFLDRTTGEVIRTESS